MTTQALNGASGPLSGIRVVELGQIAAGPFAGSLFADLGADVVKIERPDGGDGLRQWPPLSGETDTIKGFSENFASVNRNKRSVALDLKNKEHVATLKSLVGAANILIENYRPGVLSKLGLNYKSLRSINKKIIYCSISGYGQTGPYAKKGAFDVTVQGMAGIMSVTGEPVGAPVKCGVPIGDFCAGLYAAYSILAVLRQAEITGEGKHIDCSMLGSLLGISALQTSEYFGNNAAPVKMGSAHPRNAPYQAFEASDNYFVVAAGNDKLWHEVARAVNLPELANDERFATQALRAQNQTVLVALLAPSFKAKSVAHWLTELDRRNVPCAPINNFSDILNDPHVIHMGLVKPLGLPNGKTTKTIVFPVSISGFEQINIKSPPALGADNQAVLNEWLSKDHG